ncbi:MAG: hypothetical protein Q7K16_02550, partial [Candidatus Azambacteria bacterium]|nr:hypothetical protein [Candidatus Azambacteria bacterium]
KDLGGRITFHPPAGIAKGLGNPDKPIPDKLLEQAKLVAKFIKFGLEAYTIHLAPAMANDPPEEMGLERYNSPIGAEEMFEHIKRQVEPLKQLNELMQGILHIENVDITNFRDGGYRVPTFLALQTGCWLDLKWLKDETGVKTTVDTEHYFCARNLLKTEEDLKLHFGWIVEPTKSQEKLEEITGYWLKEGKWPMLARELTWQRYIKTINPELFHLGGAYRAVDDKERIMTHLPIDIKEFRQKDVLDYQLELIMAGQGIGAVIEVWGQLHELDKYSPMSPRPLDDEVARMMTYLTVVNEIEALQKAK